MSTGTEAWLAIGLVALVVFASRASGYFLGSKVREDGRLRRLFDVLPGCAIAAVIAPVIVRAGAVEIVALAAAASLLWFTHNLGLALASGLVVLIAGANLGLVL
ncbi:AzlD family protein [Minwuia thermotolerans]|nr:AzlD domain-containing protein [Minwuia thermotolerans]